MIVTKQELRKAASARGGFTHRQIRFAQRLTGSRQWKKKLLDSRVSDEDWIKFLGLKNVPKRPPRHKLEIINAMPKSDGGFWKPGKDDIPALKTKSKGRKNRGKNRSKRQKIGKKSDELFYASSMWSELRVRVFVKYDCKCMMCGESPKVHGITIRVSHILPRSKYPELSLSFDNLQLLCDTCDIGKGNKYEIDYRPAS